MDDPSKAAEIRGQDHLAGRVLGTDGKSVGWVAITDTEGRPLAKVDTRQARSAVLKSAMSGAKGDKTRIQARLAETREYIGVQRLHVTLAEGK